MKRKNLFDILIVLGIALALTGGVVIASRVQAQEPDPGLRGVLASQFAVDTAFIYQGRLIQNDSPISGTCDFEFTLYDDNQLSPVPVDGPVTQTNISVSDGYFATEVDFGSDAFTGEGRQMGIAVRCPAGSGDYTPLSGLVMLHAAPYAHSLRPGAVISGNAELASILEVENTYAGDSFSYGVHGASEDDDGIGVQGTGGYAGVEGVTSAGRGVRGHATNSSGYNYGVVGRTDSISGTGVYGLVTNLTGGFHARGVFGESRGPTGQGVYGWASSPTGENYGVLGQSASEEGIGVFGHAYQTYGTNYGVYGQSDSDDGYGIYSEGNAHVAGNLTWETKISYVSIPAAAFTAQDRATGHTNYGNRLINTPGGTFYAPVQLPHRATVTAMAFYWEDYATDNITCTLHVAAMGSIGPANDVMAYVTSNGDAGPGRSVTGTINSTYNVIDNSKYIYYLEWNLIDSSTAGLGVVIEYTITEPY